MTTVDICLAQGFATMLDMQKFGAEYNEEEAEKK